MDRKFEINRSCLIIFLFRFREEEAMMRPQEEYEFPTGYRKSFGVERFKIPEPIFNPALIDGKSSICGAAYLVR